MLGSRVSFSGTADRMAAILENSNGDISAMGHLIHIMFVSGVGFSGSAYRVLLLPVELNLIGGRRPSWKISNDYVSGTGIGYTIHFMK